MLRVFILTALFEIEYTASRAHLIGLTNGICLPVFFVHPFLPKGCVFAFSDETCASTVFGLFVIVSTFFKTVF